MIDSVRLSQQAKEQLMRLKRRTGIEHWNVLCRWALCISLSDTTEPVAANVPTDSAVEMSWKVFGGPYGDIILALLIQRHRNARRTEDLGEYLRLHLHRGIAHLAGDKGLVSVGDLLLRALPS